MCGIIGYIGKQKASSILLEGLKQLEYRGYDSAGRVISIKYLAGTPNEKGVNNGDVGAKSNNADDLQDVLKELFFLFLFQESFQNP